MAHIRAVAVKKYEKSAHLAEYLHFYSVTCLEYLTRPKRKDNTSGVTGVYPTKDKYYAKIGF